MKYKLNLMLVLLLFPVALYASANKTKSNSLDKNKPVSHAPHWAYSGSEGPDNWGGLSPDFSECKAGKRQSPVNLRVEKAKTSRLYDLETNYRPVMLNVKNNGHTLQVNYHTENNRQKIEFGGNEHVIKMPAEYRSALNLGGSDYKLLQFHFHSPSEHAKNGKRYPLEVHFVHQNKNKNLAVIGVFFEEGKVNPDFQAVLNNAPRSVGSNSVNGALINAANLLPSNHKFFHYIGSLTTPPCSENVNWYVMKKPLKVSPSQIRSFINIIGKNARPLQNLNWRTIYQSK